VRVSYIIVPNIAAVSGRKDGYLALWHVPMDDTHHWRYQITFSRTAVEGPDDLGRTRKGVGPDYRPFRNRANRYLQDRAEMATRSFAGLGPAFLDHDLCVVEGAGPIQDRPQEHLGYADRAIVKLRQLLLGAMRDVEANQDPPHVVRDPAENRFPDLIVRRDFLLPRSEDWHRFWERQAVEPEETAALVGQAL
jgi:hypothetical protein